MRTRRWKAPNPALVISLIALFVALGGTTYAATSLPKNSVGTKQLKNRAVTRKKIAKKTIAGLKGSPGPRGPQGLQGPRGLQGVKGDTGPTGPSDAYSAQVAGGLDPTLSVAVTVPAGEYVAVGSANGAHTGNANENFSCELFSPDDPNLGDRASGSATVPAEPLSGVLEEQIATTTGINLPSGGTIKYDCSAPGPTTIGIGNGQLTAIKVGALH
jgi:hypothetical protein